jgi:cysteine desulfuration protein SufE
MTHEQKYLKLDIHQYLVSELLALDTPEDRLSWLMEREPVHQQLFLEERTASRKVPGCLSGLWLKAELEGDKCSFSAFSESDLVSGVVSFLCELYSNRSPEEVLEVGPSLATSLKIDGLLSTTRKRALSSTLAFFAHSAGNFARETAPCVHTAA